jgi:hypothetical protein
MNRLTHLQKEFAKDHDWFVRMNGDCIVIADRYTVHGGPLQVDEIVWTKSFKALREWAGY